MKEIFELYEEDKFRERIILITLQLGSVLGFISFVISIIGWQRSTFKIGVLIDFLTILLFITTLLFHNKLNIKSKTAIIIAGILFLVFTDLYKHGVFSDNKILLVLVPFFAYLGYNIRKSLTIFLGSVIVYFAFAALFSSKILKPTADYNIRSVAIDVWLINIFLISLIAYSIVIVIKQFIDIYNNLIAELRDQNLALKTAIEKSRESEKQFRNLFENAADAIFLADEKTGIIIDANQAAERLMLRAREELVGIHQSTLHPTDNEKYSVETFKEHQRLAGNFTPTTPIENRIVRKDGTEVPVEILASKVVYQGKNCLVGTFRDVTERKKSEVELLSAKEVAEANNANVTAIIEGTTESIWAFNRNYEIIYINHIFQIEFQQTFGVWLEPGVSLIESLPKPLRPLWKPRYDRALANEQFKVEDAIDSGNGMIYIQVSFNPIVKKGQVIGGSCFGSNITSRKLAEIELINAKERAEESDRLKSAFLANMSHEIRTPMNGIMGFASLLNEPNLSGEQQQEYIKIIEESGARMLNIINDIIDISKIEAGLMELYIQETNINKQMEFIYTFFKPEVEAKGMKILYKNSLTAEQAIVRTDREKLYAILTNLTRNAIKYSDKGSIEFGVSIGSTAGKANVPMELQFYVKDTGIGIPKDRLEAIFERFIQADVVDKMARQGAGLGLSITKAFVQMLGGQIWVESQQGIGSTFYFTLPCHEPVTTSSH